MSRNFDLDAELAAEGLTLGDLGNFGMCDIDKMLSPILTDGGQHDILKEILEEIENEQLENGTTRKA